ncbi:HlyD family secretion protein [Pseudomonas sp. TCU-HL1]|uniref:HlyD family secretion protein n=1 Tax=Pseudomonas sp. TCU-HL1 TaxID=1856685 RepID=UPI0008568918|nr:HlyD family secretion protein [Pseudomonas sp. TCU-HL1]AOE85224.1 multidrug transporter [Pseudomonas sp. TCU-HL1]
MNSLQDKAAIATDASAEIAVAVARRSNRKMVGILLCVSAVVVVAAGWAVAFSSGTTSTDNAYVRGDVTSLAAKVGGYVTALEVKDNQSVRAGDVLFRIDDQDYRAHLAQAEASIKAAQARLTNVDAETQLQRALIRQAEAQRRSAGAGMNLATKTHDRSRKLIVSHAVSQALVDETGAARSKAEATVSAASATVEAEQQRIAVLVAQREAAVAAVAQVQAARDLAQIDLESTVVRAPVDGVVGNRQVRVGRFVTPGVALLDISPVNDVWVVANFKETQLEHIHPGQRVRITIDGYSNDALEGVVDSFAPGSGSAFSLLPTDNATGNFVRVVQRVPVKIRLAHNPLPGRIVPGLSARVEVAHGGDHERGCHRHAQQRQRYGRCPTDYGHRGCHADGSDRQHRSVARAQRHHRRYLRNA